MKNFIPVVALFFLHLSAASQEKKFSVEIAPEYKNENFRWSIAGNEQGENPNILSELIFKPVHSAGFYVNGSFHFLNRFSANAYYNKLWTYDGEVTDFDYDGDNRTLPVTQLYLQSKKGNANSLGGSLNYHVLIKNDFDVSFGAGYDVTKELFYITDDTNPLLKSTYETEWNGPNLSCNGAFSYNIFSIGAGITGNYLQYNAKANWNLVETFEHPVSFRQDAKGYGFDCRLSLGFQPESFMKITLHGLYSDWRTNYGADRLFTTDEGMIKSRMNGAFKKNFGLRISTAVFF
jgi:hypothetical protein